MPRYQPPRTGGGTGNTGTNAGAITPEDIIRMRAALAEQDLTLPDTVNWQNHLMEHTIRPTTAVPTTMNRVPDPPNWPRDAVQQPRQTEHYYNAPNPVGRGAQLADGYGQVDYLGLDEETHFNDWTPQEIKKEKNTKTKVVTIDKETYDSIHSLTNVLMGRYLRQLKDLYKIRLDSIESEEYTSFIESYSNNEEIDAELFRNYSSIAFNWQMFTTSEELNGNNSWYLGQIEEEALKKYDINHSKYKYYPRLKSKIKYGNAELLSKILTVTRIGRGKVICK